MLGQVPGLQILTPGGADDAYGLMKWALLESQNPTVFLSHPLLFAETAELVPGAPTLPVGKARIRREGRDVSIIASSITVPRAMAAAQALDFRQFTPGKGTAAAKAAVRKVVAHLEEDRPLFPDHNAMMESVSRCEVLEAVESAIGPLKSSW
jgi:pyruvate dehydrogenase E1 component beta subunit